MSRAHTELAGLRAQLNDCKGFIAGRRLSGIPEVELIRAMGYEAALMVEITVLEQKIAEANEADERNKFAIQQWQKFGVEE